MWDRLRHKGGLAPLNRKKLEAWQDSHSSTSVPVPAPPAQGIRGGNSQYQYAVKGGHTLKKSRDSNHQPDIAQQQQQRSGLAIVPPVHTRPNSGRSLQPCPPYEPSPHAQQIQNDVANPEHPEVSPPSSPGLGSWEGVETGDVSPIDETSDSFQPGKTRRATPANGRSRSNIPSLRRERTKSSDAAINSIREANGSWDPTTDESTANTTFHPSQANSREYAHPASRAVTASFAEGRLSQPSPASFGSDLHPMRQTSAGAQSESAPRPEWQGADGPIVVPPVNIPLRSSKSASRLPQALTSVESNGLDVSSTLQTETWSSPPVLEPASSQLPPLHLPSNDKAIRRKPARETSAQHSDLSAAGAAGLGEFTHPASRFSSASYAASDRTATPPTSFDGDTHPSPTPTQLSTPLPNTQPASVSILDRGRPVVGYDRSPSLGSSRPTSPTSGFQTVPLVSILDRGRPIISGYDKLPSLTTSPRPSTPTSVPAPQIAPAVSMLDRGRPFAPGYQKPTSPKPDDTVKISLESSYYNAPPSMTAMKPSGLQGMMPNEDKSLPPVPPEVLAKDRIAELNAQLEALGNRRINVNTAIRKMTEMMPVDNVLASVAVVRKREDEKRKVETLRAELAEIERQSYELGLRLHLAYKRLDRNQYQPTSLWVNRMTN